MDPFPKLLLLVTCSVLMPNYGSMFARSASLKPIKLTVLFEMYCPDSMDFINGQLWPTYQQLKDYISLDLLPHGKANQSFDKNTNRWHFSCQHGPPECHGNLITTCAIHISQRNESIYLPFAKCFFEGDPTDWFFNGFQGKRNPMKTGKKCAEDIGISWSRLNECINGDEGNQLQHDIASRTPRLGYVPWIYVNGRSGGNLNNKAETNLKELLCHLIPAPKPEACDGEADG